MLLRSGMNRVQRISHDCSLSHFDTVPTCNRQTDRQTDGFAAAWTALWLANYADAL